MRSAPSAQGGALAFVAWLIGASVALAHSELRQAQPSPNSRHKNPPSEIKLYFTERLEQAYSTVRVVDAHGAEVDRQDAHVDPVDPLLLRASLKPLDPGAYTVNWRALSLDPHMSEGHFSFQVE
jgi:methionine-rich copper-binding protein CopC